MRAFGEGFIPKSFGRCALLGPATIRKHKRMSDVGESRERRYGFDHEPIVERRRRFARALNAAPGGPRAESFSPGLDEGPTVDAVVKWFKVDKGYGFVETQAAKGDVFLHVTALHAAGADAVSAGTKLRVIVRASAKGPQVARIVQFVGTGAPERTRWHPGDHALLPRFARPNPAMAERVSGKVKWFDDARGFGFVEADGGGRDIFVHVSALDASGLQRLAQGQPVTMQVVETPRGREAIGITA